MFESTKTLRVFFERYALANNRDKLTAIADFYADSFIAAGPKGHAAFKNDGQFVEWLEQLREFNRKYGLEQMEILDYSESPIGEKYVSAIVHWGARFQKTGAELIRFAISYIVYLSNPPQIVMYISHEDQEDLMKKEGLL